MHRYCRRCQALVPAAEYAAHLQRHRDAGRERTYSGDWRKARLAALERDGYRCRVCGKTSDLEVHHTDGNWRNNAPSNLETRCTAHHPRGRAHTDKPRFKHIAITGPIASGKTTVVKRLSTATGIPHLSIEDCGLHWPRFGLMARRHVGPLIIESVALPPWPISLLVYCHCEERERQRRLRTRPREQRTLPLGPYDYRAQADVIVQTPTPDLDLSDLIIRVTAITRPAHV